MAGLIMVAGCTAGGSSPTPSQSGQLAVIKVGEVPGVGDAPLFMAFQSKAFIQAGLDVRINNYSSTKEELADLRAGVIQVAYGDYADMFYAQAQAKAHPTKKSANLVLLADGYGAVANTMAVLTLPNSGIVTPQNLQGKTVGTAPPDVMPMAPSAQGHPYSLDTLATQSVLTNNNVNPASVNWQPVPPAGPDGMIAQLAEGHVDAILATEPTIFQAEAQLGAVPVVDSCTGATSNLPLSGYFTSPSTAASRHANLVTFRNTLIAAQATANNQAGLVRATLEGSQGVSVQDASLLTIGQYPTTINTSDLQRVADLMATFNAIPAQIQVQSMIFH